MKQKYHNLLSDLRVLPHEAPKVYLFVFTSITIFFIYCIFNCFCIGYGGECFPNFYEIKYDEIFPVKDIIPETLFRENSRVLSISEFDSNYEI